MDQLTSEGYRIIKNIFITAEISAVLAHLVRNPRKKKSKLYSYMNYKDM
jgi:hypothetical protein